MIILLLCYLGFLSLFMVGFIHYTEEKINNYKNENKTLKDQILKLNPLQYEYKSDFEEK